MLALVVVSVGLATAQTINSGSPSPTPSSTPLPSRSAPRPSSAPPPPAPFNVVGTQIIGPGSQPFVPLGANVGDVAAFDGRGNANGEHAAALAWGWNTIRLTLYVTDGASFTYRSQFGYEALLSHVKSLVDEYTNAGIVVIVESHDGIAPYGSSYMNQIDQFFTDLARSSVGNPRVWFNCYNEPNADLAQWVALQRHCVSLIRDQANSNIVVADAPGAAADAPWSGKTRMYDPSMGPAVLAGNTNVIFSQHNHAGYCDYESEGAYLDAMHAAGLAVIIGEFGFSIDGSSSGGGYAANYSCALANFAAAPSRGVGLVWWHGTGRDLYSLKTDGGAFFEGEPGANLSYAGSLLWKLGH